MDVLQKSHRILTELVPLFISDRILIYISSTGFPTGFPQDFNRIPTAFLQDSVRVPKILLHSSSLLFSVFGRYAEERT